MNRFSKFGNHKVSQDGIVFDSRAELRRYDELCLLIRSGNISHLRVHVPFQIVVNGQNICKYIADFVYNENGKQVVEDVKSTATKTDVYMLKKKLMKAAMGVEIVEVMV
jgi:hypothetical protein